jgi:hypothetical protein
VGVLIVAAVAATAALGAVGEITKASVASDWTSGSFAGKVEWTGCAHLPPKKEPGEPKEPSSPESFTCTWTAYATVGPGTSPEACLGSDRDLNSLGSGVQLVWQGESRTGLGSEAFEVNDFPLDGSAGKVLCLATRERSTDGTEVPCVPPGEPIPPGWHCPYVMTNYFSTLDSRVLEAPASQPSGQAEPKFCGCPAMVSVRPHHKKHRRHRHIFVSQHQKVPEA